MTHGELVLWPGQEVVSWGFVLEGELQREGSGERLLSGDLVGEAAMLYDGAHVEGSGRTGMTHTEKPRTCLPLDTRLTISTTHE
jgi:hypothetical protein